jgi:hypothetical protein
MKRAMLIAVMCFLGCMAIPKPVTTNSIAPATISVSDTGEHLITATAAANLATKDVEQAIPLTTQPATKLLVDADTKLGIVNNALTAATSDNESTKNELIQATAERKTLEENAVKQSDNIKKLQSELEAKNWWLWTMGYIAGGLMLAAGVYLGVQGLMKSGLGLVAAGISLFVATFILQQWIVYIAIGAIVIALAIAAWFIRDYFQGGVTQVASDLNKVVG